MSRALHAQHDSFKLKPIVERHAVLRQFGRERNHFESGPRCSIQVIQRADATIATRQKVLPEMSCHQAGWRGYEIDPISSSSCDLWQIAWQRNIDEVCVTGLVRAVEVGDL